MKKPILILKMGETMPYLYRRRGDFEDWIRAPWKRPAGLSHCCTV